MKLLSLRKTLVGAGLVGFLGLAAAVCLLWAAWSLNRTYPEARLLSRAGPSYHSTCRWFGCTWTVLSSSHFLTEDDVDQVYEWYWNNRRVWDVRIGSVYVRLAFLELGGVEQHPTRYRLETELLLAVRQRQEP